MNILWLSILMVIFVFSSTKLVAQEAYVCLYGSNERIIKIEYENANSKVPCSVIYEKSTGKQVLWRAQNVEGYCESKFAEFIAKQQGWGWDCTEMSEAQMADSGSASSE